MKDSVGPVFESGASKRLEQLVRRYLSGRTALFEERVERGMACDCHGDLKADGHSRPSLTFPGHAFHLVETARMNGGRDSNRCRFKDPARKWPCGLNKLAFASGLRIVKRLHWTSLSRNWRM
jgi:hypothetical protein